MLLTDFVGDFKIPHIFSGNTNSDCLLVFLPSVRSKDIYPYYPRLSWSEFFQKHCNVLFLSDPFQTSAYCQEAGGSWFFNRDGSFSLPAIAEWIKDIAAKNKIKKIVFYGSSMGGYGSLVLGCLIPGSISFAECPQIFLEKHPGSSSVLRNLGLETKAADYSVESFFKFRGSATFNIIVSAHDHHLKDHVLPFVSIITNQAINQSDVVFTIYSRKNYKNGHVALSFIDASVLILNEISK